MSRLRAASLLYLAHTHVPTIWDKQGIKLEPLEWQEIKNGWYLERTLPNKVVFGTRVNPRADYVRMEMWLTNGTAETLRGLVVQNCVMLKGLAGFEQQTNDNKLFAQALRRLPQRRQDAAGSSPPGNPASAPGATLPAPASTATPNSPTPHPAKPSTSAAGCRSLRGRISRAKSSE